MSMNRRAFLKGLLASTAVASVLPALPVAEPAGSIWSVASEGGFMYSDELSDVLLQQSVPLNRLRLMTDDKVWEL